MISDFYPCAKVKEHLVNLQKVYEIQKYIWFLVNNPQVSMTAAHLLWLQDWINLLRKDRVNTVSGHFGRGH